MKKYNKINIHWWLQCSIFIVFIISYATAQAQVFTKPKIYFPLNIENSSNGKKLPSSLSNIANISAILDVGESIIDHYDEDRHSRGSSSFFFDRTNLDVPNARRLKIANQAGTSTALSFFGINTSTGYDVTEMTISCWVYVDPNEDKNRYIFYGADANGKLGFGLRLLGENLYLIKYVNNATAAKGAKITGTSVGNSWEGKLLGPATFNAGIGWYQVILVQGPHYTRLFVGMPPAQVNGVWQGKKGKYNKAFAGSMVIHGKQNLTPFTRWGIGVPEGQINDGLLPVQKADDFMVFDYAMTETQAQALYQCQVSNKTDDCFGLNQTFTQDFAIIADYGCDGGVATVGFDTIYNPVEKVANMVKSWSPDYILSLGDDSYSSVVKPAFTCAADIDNNVGKFYHEFIYPYNGAHGSGSPSGTNRFFPIMGNHDRDCPHTNLAYTCLGGDYFRCSCIWENYFPTENYAPYNGRYYTFTQGNIQFFAIHSNKEEPDSSTYKDSNGNINPQAQWLKNALAASNATFKVVYMHHPPYASFIAGHDGVNGTRRMSEWPFKEWGADIVIAGDYHFYERNDYKNLTIIINGIGGYPGLGNASAINLGTRIHVEGEYGAIQVEANDKMMRFRVYTIDPTDQANRSKDRLRDEFWLYKRATGATYLVENPAELVHLQAEDEEIRQQVLIVYPNPTNDELTLRLQEQAESNATITLLDFSGKQVYMQPVTLSKGAQEISLGNLKAKGIAKGVYFLQVVSPERNSTVKVVMQ